MCLRFHGGETSNLQLSNNLFQNVKTQLILKLLPGLFQYPIVQVYQILIMPLVGKISMSRMQYTGRHVQVAKINKNNSTFFCTRIYVELSNYSIEYVNNYTGYTFLKKNITKNNQHVRKYPKVRKITLGRHFSINRQMKK